MKSLRGTMLMGLFTLITAMAIACVWFDILLSLRKRA